MTNAQLGKLLLLLLAITWLPGLAIALTLAQADDQTSGPLVVVFSPFEPEHKHFRRLQRAGGSLIDQTWLTNTWVVHSQQTGFASRLHTHGAWLTLALDALKASTRLGCARRGRAEPFTSPP